MSRIWYKRSAYMEGGGERPARPVLPQGERSRSSPIGKAVIPVTSIVEKLRAGLEQKRRYKQEQGGFFHPQWWLFDKLIDGASEMGVAGDPQELVDFFRDTAIAYGILAYSKLHPLHKATFRDFLLDDMGITILDSNNKPKLTAVCQELCKISEAG